MSLVSSGFIYQKFIDPALSSVHKAAVRQIPENANVIDIACGTGALALMMASKAKKVTGIDLSEEMIETAKKTAHKFGVTNTEFRLQDACELHVYADNEFDVATISLAIHQFSLETASQVIEEIERISARIMIIDYACPLPKNFYKPLIQTIERLAGREHSTNFKAYQKLGGISYYTDKLNLSVIRKTNVGKGNFSITVCSK